MVKMLIVRKNRQKMLEEELWKIAGMMDTHFVVKSQGERNGFVLLSIEEFGWKNMWGPIWSFLLRIKSIEHVEDTSSNIETRTGILRRDLNRMKVVPEKGIAFEELRRAFLEMRGPAWLRMDIRQAGDEIIIRDLIGLELFESLSKLSLILDGTRAVPKEEIQNIKQKCSRKIETVRQVGMISRHYIEVGEGYGCSA